MDAGRGETMELYAVLPEGRKYRPRADKYRRVGWSGYRGSSGGRECIMRQKAMLYPTAGRI